VEDDVRLDKKKKHTIDAVVDRLIAKPGIHQRLNDSVETALRYGGGIVVVAPEGKPEKVMSQHRACHDCGISFPEPSPQLFSFNSPLGMCPSAPASARAWRWIPSWWCRTRTCPSTRAR
jgi:excinuclease ABC subunit A